MDEPEQKGVDDPRVYLAAERTLLAWIRTGLSLMGFGFVVARFGLFLREIAAARIGARGADPVPGPGPGPASLWFGVVLVAAGVIVNMLAAIDHTRVVRALRRGDATTATKSMMGVVLGVALAVLGTAVAIYLVSASR